MDDDFVIVGGESLHRLELEPADDGWACVTLLGRVAVSGAPEECLGYAAVHDAPDGCLGIVEYPERRGRSHLTFCSKYCGDVAALVRWRRHVEREGRHRRPQDGDRVLKALWRKESDLLSGEFYEQQLAESERQEVFAVKGRRCLLCGAKATDIDHIDPAGGNHFSNLQPLCQACHLRKTENEGGEFTSLEEAGASRSRLAALVGAETYLRARSSGIRMFALEPDEDFARYASYLKRVYAEPPRLCDDEQSWKQVEPEITRERRSQCR